VAASEGKFSSAKKQGAAPNSNLRVRRRGEGKIRKKNGRGMKVVHAVKE